MLIYLDSMILMYFFDHTGAFNVRASNQLAALATAGDLIAVSHLVRLECRVKPIMNSDAARLALYDAFFARPDVRIVPIAPPCSTGPPSSGRPTSSSWAIRCTWRWRSKAAAT